MLTYEEMVLEADIKSAEARRNEVINDMMEAARITADLIHLAVAAASELDAPDFRGGVLDPVWMGVMARRVADRQCEVDWLTGQRTPSPRWGEPDETGTQSLNQGVPDDVFEQLQTKSADELQEMRVNAQAAFDQAPARDIWAYIATIAAITNSRDAEQPRASMA